MVADMTATDFVGYTEKKCDAEVVFIIADGESRGSITAGDEAVLVLDRTPFYAESGGLLVGYEDI